MEREVLEFDVQFVGAGPAGLAGAIHLANLIENHNQAVAAGGPGQALNDVTIAVLEKSARVGAHGISGAVLDPRALRELMPDFRERGCPIESDVRHDDVLLLWEKGKLRLPLVPPMLDNHGNVVLSLGNLVAWLAEVAESKGVLIATETPAAAPLVENGRVVGVRTGDKGINKRGERKPNYQPGADCRAKATVLCEGPRGTIAKVLEKQLGLTSGRNAQVYSTGVKEVWEMPPGRVEAGRVIHTMGWPLPHETFGGGFIYGMGDTRGRSVSSPASTITTRRPTRTACCSDSRRTRSFAGCSRAARWSRTGPRRFPRAAGGRCPSSRPTGSCCAATPAGS
jgi:electron-transferring-flavoprotein dehydrogenase